MAKIVTKKLSDQVYDYLREQIMEGNLYPGAALDLEKIREDLQISQSPLRDALIRLEAEGFLTIFPRSKVVMNRLDIEDISYLFEIIGTLETAMITHSLHRYTKPVLAQMRKLHQKMVKALEEGKRREYDQLHKDFHNIFMKVAENKFVDRILDPIKSRLWDLPKKDFPLQWIQDACAEHLEIIEAIENKDIEKIKQTIENKHWNFEYNKDFILMTYFN